MPLLNATGPLRLFAILVAATSFTPAACALTQGECSPPVQVFILAGQSNMVGHGVVSMNDPEHHNGGKGNLLWSMEHSASKNRMKHLKDADGTWRVRDDVSIRFKVRGKVREGALTVGYTEYGGMSHIGPELQFGVSPGADELSFLAGSWHGKKLGGDFQAYYSTAVDPHRSGSETHPFELTRKKLGRLL